MGKRSEYYNHPEKEEKRSDKVDKKEVRSPSESPIKPPNEPVKGPNPTLVLARTDDGGLAGHGSGQVMPDNERYTRLGVGAIHTVGAGILGIFGQQELAGEIGGLEQVGLNRGFNDGNKQ